MLNNDIDLIACDINDKKDFSQVINAFVRGYYLSINLYEIDQNILGNNSNLEEIDNFAKL